MKILKKVLIICIFVIAFSFSLNVSAKNLVLSDGTEVLYKGTTINVQIQDSYDQPETYWRAVWVTPIANCLPSCTNSNIQTYKNEIIEMYDVMEAYNLNVCIFHMRMYNDATYPSSLNPKSSFYTATTDLMPWIIEEAHKRGIEFHAWLNPYRVLTTSSTTRTCESVANGIKNKCSNNAGSNPDNLLVSNRNAVILNPGEPAVRNFIVETCMEIIRNYDVDAIHFDDYFYIDGVDDSLTKTKYDTENLSSADWRRKQVDLFIEQLSRTVREYNTRNNRYVQIGIAPTGIYKNGNGKVTYDSNNNAVTTGSNTGGQTHYSSYLFCDTVKWINNEWIDYICPQSYWAFTHKSAGFAEVMSWWDKVCKYKNVNLYSGMGVYMADETSNIYSWKVGDEEAMDQILYCYTLENVEGTSVYNYNSLEGEYKGRTTAAMNNMKKVRNNLFTKKSILPVVKSMKNNTINDCTLVSLTTSSTSNTLKFRKNNDAKFYIIYRSTSDVTFNQNEVIDIIGNESSDFITYTDKVSNGSNYKYGVKCQHYSNVLSNGVKATKDKFTVKFYNANNSVISTQQVSPFSDAIAPTNMNVPGKVFNGWDKEYTCVEANLDIYPLYTNLGCYTVNFYDIDNNILKTEEVYSGSNATPPNSSLLTSFGREFVRWDKSYNNVTSDLDIYPVYNLITYVYIFKDINGNELERKNGTIEDNITSNLLDNDIKNKKMFKEWSYNYSNTTCNVTCSYDYFNINVIYKIDDTTYKTTTLLSNSNLVLEQVPSGYPNARWDYSGDFGSSKDFIVELVYETIEPTIEYTITYVDENNIILGTETVKAGEDAKGLDNIPNKSGYKFIGYNDVLTNIQSDKTIKLIYEKNSSSGCSWFSFAYIFELVALFGLLKTFKKKF